MIRYANKNDLPQIIALWDSAFPEDLDFNKYFFEKLFRLENTLVLIVENTVVSMLQEIPYYIEGLGDVMYIYGVATHKDYRNKGYMKQLLDCRHKEINVPCVLIPANEGLFDYYKKFGYITQFYIEKNTFVDKSNTDLKPDPVNIQELNRIYETVLENIPHPKRTTEYWQTQIDMFENLGGEVLYFENMGYCFLWTGVPEIQEVFAFSDEDVNKICNYVCNMCNTDSIKYSAKGSKPFGMIRGGNMLGTGYMNLMFN